MSMSRAGWTSTRSKTATSCVHDARIRDRNARFISKPPAHGRGLRTDAQRDISGGASSLAPSDDPESHTRREQRTGTDRADLRPPRAIVRALREIRGGADRALVGVVAAERLR